jgi:hypothetical protein
MRVRVKFMDGRMVRPLLLVLWLGGRGEGKLVLIPVVIRLVLVLWIVLGGRGYIKNIMSSWWPVGIFVVTVGGTG